MKGSDKNGYGNRMDIHKKKVGKLKLNAQGCKKPMVRYPQRTIRS
jgi:hypothetical protein